MYDSIVFPAILSMAMAIATGASADVPVDGIVSDIVASNFHKVGVLPTVVYDCGTQRGTVGELGPRAPSMATRIHDLLEKAAPQSNFSLASMSDMTQALNRMEPSFLASDLDNPDRVRELWKVARLDAVVLLTKKVGPESQRATKDHIDLKLISLADNFKQEEPGLVEERTLAKAAYGGESWQLRRWDGEKIENVGINIPTGFDERAAFGKGVKWEKWQYRHLKKDLCHPLTLQERASFGLRIKVGRNFRTPAIFGEGREQKLVVALDPGETYTVWLTSKCKKPVMAALYVDGISTIDRKAVEPEDLEDWRHWVLKTEGEYEIPGWYQVKRDSTLQPVGQAQTRNAFTIEKRKASVAFGSGFQNNIGMITAIFYTGNKNMKGIPQPPESLLTGRSIPVSDFGTGLGREKEQKLQFTTDYSRGIILEAITVYYRTTSQIEGMRQGTRADPVIPTAPLAKTSPSSLDERSESHRARGG